MAFQPAPACANVTIQGRSVASSLFAGENSLNFLSQAMTTVTQSQIESLVDVVADWWATNMEALCTSFTQLDKVEGRGLASQEDVYHVINPAYVGNVAGDPLPFTDTVAVSFRTGTTGRSARGRAYQWGLAEAHTNGSFLTTAFSEALITAWEALQTAVQSEGFDHVVLSRWSNGVLRENARPLAVTSYILVDDIVDTQRGRKPD